MNSNVGEGPPTVNPEPPDPDELEDDGEFTPSALDILALQAGLPIRQVFLCNLLGIGKKQLNQWENAGCPRIQIAEHEAQGTVRYSVEDVQGWMRKFDGSLEPYRAKNSGKPKKQTRRRK